MSAEMTKGQEVAEIRGGTVVDITTITLVRKRLGKVTGYETTGQCKWSAHGHSPGTWSRSHIEPATPKHREDFARARIVYQLSATNSEAWAKLTTEQLEQVVALLGGSVTA